MARFTSGSSSLDEAFEGLRVAALQCKKERDVLLNICVRAWREIDTSGELGAETIFQMHDALIAFGCIDPPMSSAAVSKVQQRKRGDR